MHEKFSDNRIAIEPAPIRSGDFLNIKYHGILKNSGADAIYLHYGKDGWQNLRTIKMERLPEGIFGAKITAEASKEINFCFKDSANNWDNNNGFNWTCNVLH